MSHVQLDAARLAADGSTLFSVAQSVSQAVRACESALGGTGGMAGDDESAEVFAHGQDGEPGYDQYAVDVMKSALGMANALRIVDAALGNTGRAYDGAQLVGAFQPASSSRIPEENPSVVPPSASVPTSLGKGPEGPLGEFGDFLKDGLATLGVVLPSADRGKLSSAESAWSELSGAMTRAQSRIDGAFTNVSSMTLPQKSNILSCQRSLGSSFGKVADSADSMAGFARGMIDAVDKAWEEIGWFIAQMAVEIAIEIGVGALLGAVTFGAGAAAMAAKIMLTVTRWAIKIAALCKKLRTLIMMALRAARMAIRGGIRVAREALSAGLASGITTVSFNSVRGALDPNYQPQNVLNAALSAAVGGAAGGGFSGAGGRLTSGVNPGAMQRVTHIAVETGGGAVDGLASGLAESGLSGQPFQPLSSMAAGALLGGALAGRPGGGGHAPSTPGGTGGSGGPGGAGPDIDTSGIPSGTGTNANAGTPGGGGQVDVSNDAPTPGSGGGGSNTSGGGGQVDVSNDAPTPGSGGADGAGSGADGGSVDLPGAVDSSGVDLSDGSTVDAPAADAPAADAPTADAPTAEAPTHSDAPAADAPTHPDAPTHVESPAAEAPSQADAPTQVESPTHADAPTHVESPATDAPTHVESPTQVESPATDTPTQVESPATDAPTQVESPTHADAPTHVESPATDAPTPAEAPTQVESPTHADAPAADAPAADAPAVDAPAAEAPVAAGTGSPSTAHPAAATVSAPSDADIAASADAVSSDADADAGSGADENGSGEASDTEANGGIDTEDIDVEDAAAAGGAAAAAGAAALAFKPSLLTPQTPGSANAAGAGSGSTPPANPKPHASSERTLAEADQARGEINPNFDPSDPENGYATNCGNTSANYFDYLNGNPVAEAGTGTLGIAEMEARTGFPQTPATPEQIEATLRSLGAGSHCVVGIDRTAIIDGQPTPVAGHWMTAYFDGDTVWAVDAQNDTRSPWPPHEPLATNWDASIHPENVVNPDGTNVYDVDSSSTDAADATSPATAADATHAAPDAANAPTGADATADAGTGSADADASSTDVEGGEDRSGRKPWSSKATVPPNHPSDGSAGPGTTYNGYDIPDLTPEIRAELDKLAATAGSPIVKNPDGSYSLKDPIIVAEFNRSDPNLADNPNHDWDEFQRQVGLQQQGLNQLTVAEWRHNVDFYDEYNRVASSAQSTAIKNLKAAGVPVTNPAALHGPDQVAGGRPNRFDGAGDLGINSSLGAQWGQRTDPLGISVDAAMARIPDSLHAHIRLNVQLGARNLETNAVASQATLTSAQPITSATPAGATPAGATPAGATPAGATPAAAPAAGATSAGTSPSAASSPGTASSGAAANTTVAPARIGSSSDAVPARSGSAWNAPAPASSHGEGMPASTGTVGGDASDPSAVGASHDAPSVDGTAHDGGDNTTDGVTESRADEPIESSSEPVFGADDAAEPTQSSDAQDAGAPVQPTVPSTMYHPGLDANFDRLTSPEAVADAVRWVNETGIWGDRGRFGNNCHYVVNAFELRMRGYDVIASPTVQSSTHNPTTNVWVDAFEGRMPSQIAADWIQTDGTRREFTQLSQFGTGSAADVLDALTASWPIGGRGFIGGMWKTGGGHVFTIVKEADGIRLLDGQVNKADVSEYLDELQFDPVSAAWKDISVLRVDDLVPTAEVVKTSKRWNTAEYQLIVDWRNNPDAPPQEMVQREIAANERWQQRNDELIAERDQIIADPNASESEKRRAMGERRAFLAQNDRLASGLDRFKATYAPQPPAAPDGADPSGVGQGTASA